MNTTTEYLYRNDSALYSSNDHYEKSNSQSPQQNCCIKNQSPQQLNFDCDEETQYSLSEFSHIHLVDGESAENDNFNNCSAHVNNAESAYSIPNFSLAASIKPSQNLTNTFHKNTNTGISTNYLDVNQLAILNNNRKRALSFATGTNDSSMFSLSSMPLINASTTQQALTTNLQNINNNITNNNGNNNEKQRTATKICRVCGDKAYSYNFNVITCESCKAFFRRNANKEKEIRCPFNEQCDINIVSRRFCQRCRLQKCFRVGMKKEWIMTEEARLEKKQRIQTNRERRLAERKRRSGSAEELINTSINITNTNNSTTVNLSNNLSESSEKLINNELISSTENTETAAVAAAHQLFREQQQTTSILLDSSKNLSVNMPSVQPSSINIVSQQNNGNSSVLIQSNVQPISLIPSIMNVRPSTDIVVANHNVTQQIVAAAAAVQFNTTSPQQHLEHIAKTIASHQQQQLEQIGQTLQQKTTNEQKLEPIDHQPNVLSTTTNNISLEQQQQNVSQTFIKQVAQSLANQQQHQFDQAVQSFAVQQNQQNLLIGGNGHTAQSCITTTTAICPTFCTDQQVTSSHNQLNNNTINSQTDVTIAAAAVAVAAAAAQQQKHQPISNILNSNFASQQQQQHQVEHANLAAVVQQHQIMQQQAAVQQFQQLKNQQIIAQQQQVVAVQQQIAAAVAAASCMQSSSSPVISNTNIATAAAGNQPQQIVNTSTQQNSSTLSNNQSFVLDPTAAVANILPPQAIVPSTSSTLSATIQPPSSQQPQTQQTQASILPQLIELPNAAAAVASILPSQTIGPSASSTLSATAQTQQIQAQPTKTLILPQLMELPSAAAAVAAAAVSQPSISQDMVTVPKEVLIKLVEHKIELDQQQQQSEAKPVKCQCHCQCGRYPTDMLIVDKVMTDLLENSSKQYSIETRRNSSFQSTPPAPDQLMTNNNNLTNTSSNLNLLSLNQSSFYSGQILKQQTTSNLDASNSAMETGSEIEINADYCKLALCDEENLNELLRANGIWNSEPGETQYGVTESGLKRLIKTISSIATFRLLDRNDQTLLLKHFPIEWRKNETIVLLLGMILLFNPDIPDLNSRLTVTMESLKYQSIMKRVLYALCGNDIQMAAQTFNTLLSKLEHLQAAATLCALENVEPIVKQIFEPISINVTTSGSIIGMSGGPSNNLIIDNLVS